MRQVSRKSWIARFPSLFLSYEASHLASSPEGPAFQRKLAIRLRARHKGDSRGVLRSKATDEHKNDDIKFARISGPAKIRAEDGDHCTIGTCRIAIQRTGDVSSRERR